MKAKVLGLCFSFFFLNALAQEGIENTSRKDAVVSDKKLKIKLDVLSRYIWRGQSWGGDYVVFQPNIEYTLGEKVVLGVWGTSNFKKDYFYLDGSSYKGYQELDFYVSYAVNDFISLQLWDYYWPSVEKVKGVDNRFFNYKSNSVKTLDFIVAFDFSETKLPFNATLSTLIAGNDFRYDAKGQNPKQNFTTYAEIGYTVKNVLHGIRTKPFQDIKVSSSVGVVFNNQSGYYIAGDYDKPSLVNLTLKTSKEFGINKNWKLPISCTYIHNAATKNTATFGRNFMILATGLAF